jgi:hypothetical protein
MKKYGLTVRNIVNAAHDVLKRKDKLTRFQRVGKKLKKQNRKKTSGKGAKKGSKKSKSTKKKR